MNHALYTPVTSKNKNKKNPQKIVTLIATPGELDFLTILKKLFYFKRVQQMKCSGLKQLQNCFVFKFGFPAVPFKLKLCIAEIKES